MNRNLERIKKLESYVSDNKEIDWNEFNSEIGLVFEGWESLETVNQAEDYQSKNDVDLSSSLISSKL